MINMIRITVLAIDMIIPIGTNSANIPPVAIAIGTSDWEIVRLNPYTRPSIDFETTDCIVASSIDLENATVIPFKDSKKTITR